jgi:hypothetical protein
MFATDCIVDVHATDTDAKSNCKRALGKVLELQEKKKKCNYLKPCLKNRHHFTPFVCSVDGLLCCKANTFAKCLTAKLATKWQQPYSQTCGYITARLSIAIVHATHLCLQGRRHVPAHIFSTWRILYGRMVLASHFLSTSFPNDCHVQWLP